MRIAFRMTGARIGLWAAAGALTLAMLACSTSTPAPAPVTRQIAIRSFAFVPPTVQAHVGDTLVWTNEDVVPHTATDSAHALSSGRIDARGSWRHVVRQSGTYRYVCAFHPAMQGTLEVR